MTRVAEDLHFPNGTVITPDGGTLIVAETYACMLGGPDRRTLFVLTNTGSGPAMAQKTDGRIETHRVDVPGAGLP